MAMNPHYDNNDTETKAKIASIKKEGDSFKIILNDTVFRPQSGGQPSDEGWLISDNEKIPVFKVSEENNKIIHWAKEKPNSEIVTVKINPELRLTLTRMHSAEHIFFGSLHRIKKDAEVEKISLQKEQSQIFVKANNLTFEEVLKAEELVLDIIQRNLKRIIYYRNKNELNDLINRGLRIKVDRIKSNKVRVIEFDNYDISACSGTHVKETSQIKDFLITDFKYERGHYIITFTVGDKASKLREKMSKEYRLTKKLLGENVLDNVKKLIGEKKELKEKYKDCLIERISRLQPEIINGITFYCKEFENEETKILTKNIKNLCKTSFSVFLNKKENITEVILCSDIEEIKCDEIIKSLLREFGGKGGGNKKLGVCSINENSDKVLSWIKQKILKR